MRGTGTVHRGSPAHPTLPHQGRDNRQACRSMTGKPPVLRSSPRAVSQRQREHTRPRAASTSVVENKGTRGKESNIRKCLEKMFLCSLTWKKKIKVYSTKIYVSQKTHPHEPVGSTAVGVRELPHGSRKIRGWGWGEGPPRER